MRNLEIGLVRFIGVKNADLNELKTVSVQSKFTHYIDRFDDLNLVEPHIVSTLKNIPKVSGEIHKTSSRLSW